MKILPVLFISGILVSCSTFNALKLNISNDYEEITIKNKNGESVYSLYCRISGNVNGNFEIEFSNGENLLEKILPENGKINFKYEGDWYANEFVIKIIPNGNVNGYIKYRIKKVYLKCKRYISHQKTFYKYTSYFKLSDLLSLELQWKLYCVL